MISRPALRLRRERVANRPLIDSRKDAMIVDAFGIAAWCILTQEATAERVATSISKGVELADAAHTIPRAAIA